MVRAPLNVWPTILLIALASAHLHRDGAGQPDAARGRTRSTGTVTGGFAERKIHARPARLSHVTDGPA
jgi:hypothetical protein